MQRVHRQSWPRVCDVNTPPGGVTKERCNRLVGFRWKQGECVYIRAAGASVPVDPPTGPGAGNECPGIPEPWLCNAIVNCTCISA